MNIKENFNNIEAQENIDKKTKHFFDELKLEGILKEIRTNFWEYGKIKIKTPYSYNQKLYFPFHSDKDDSLIELTARWPKFVPDHFEKTSCDIDDVYIKPRVKLTGPSIYIKVSPSLTEIITSEECASLRDGHNSTKHVFLESNLNFNKEEIEKHKDEIKNTITDFCTQEKLKGIFPLINEIERDRQEIIERIKFKELPIKDIPKNFLSENTRVTLTDNYNLK